MDSFEQVEQPQKRPVFLTVLCILTFISIGLTMIGFIFNLFRGPQTADEMEKELAQASVMVNQLRDMNSTYLADQIEKINQSSIYINDSFYLVMTCNFVAMMLGFGGALMMWRGRKLGFHGYILYNLLSVLMIYFVVPVSEVPTLVPILGVLFSAIFIFMYSRNLYWLK